MGQLYKQVQKPPGRETQQEFYNYSNNISNKLKNQQRLVKDNNNEFDVYMNL